jgi:hypothetical protein
MRKGTRLVSADTKAPEPWRVVTRPSARSAATASRTTVRLTPHGLHQLLLGRQPGTRRQPAAANLARNARNNLLHQVAGRPQRLQ